MSATSLSSLASSARRIHASILLWNEVISYEVVVSRARVQHLGQFSENILEMINYVLNATTSEQHSQGRDEIRTLKWSFLE